MQEKTGDAGGLAYYAVKQVSGSPLDGFGTGGGPTRRKRILFCTEGMQTSKKQLHTSPVEIAAAFSADFLIALAGDWGGTGFLAV